MTITSLDPIATSDFGYAQAQHLLNRAGFGGTPVQITALQEMGLDQAVDFLVDYRSIEDKDLGPPRVDGDIIRPYTQQEKQLFKEAKENKNQDVLDRLRSEQLAREVLDREQMARLEQWWLARMISTPRPMEEKLTLLWHGHFASNDRTVRDSYLMFRQNELFRTYASSSFTALANSIIRDPAMIRFLNNDSNNKAHPNENLGRELMELFTLGVGHYTEQDIKEGFRSLTGYGVDDHEFRFHPRVHDDGTKTILGQTGSFDGEDFVRIILAQRQCSIWVSYKLYRHFVADIGPRPDNQTQSVIDQMADTMLSHQYEIRPVLKQILKSRHFYDPSIIGNQIKSPVQLVVGAARMLNTPINDVGILADAMSTMGQKLFDPPSVAGWDVGRGWINTSTLFVRQNLCAYLITGKLPFNDGWSSDKIEYDPSFLVADLPKKTPETVADRLMTTLLGCQAPMQRREELVKFLKDRHGPSRDVLIAATLLITAMPEYQLC